MSTSGSGLRSTIPPAYQADAVLNQNAPASGTQYTVLATVQNARIYSISSQCTWTVQPNPLEIWLTIDGIAGLFTIANPVSATWYDCYNQTFVATTGGNMIPYTNDAEMWRGINGFPIEGKSILIQAEITGGTVQNLSARVKYAKW